MWIRHVIFAIGIVAMIQGCDIGEATLYDRVKPNEITKEQFFGEYYSIFPLGEFVLDFKPFDNSFKPVEKRDGVYQMRIYWKSGRVYKSEWQPFYLVLDYERPYVELDGLKHRLARHETIYSTWRNLEEELTDVGIDAYKSTGYSSTLYFNHDHEIILWLGPDPNVWYAKRSKKYTTPQIK